MHTWDNPEDEIRFAWFDVRKAYEKIAATDLTLSSIHDAKKEMDTAMERLDRAICWITHKR
jgi:hypothetical protein